MKHKLLKKPVLKIERVSSIEEDDISDMNPKRYTNKDFFLKMADLYNKMMFSNEKPEDRAISTKPNSRRMSLESSKQFIVPGTASPS